MWNVPEITPQELAEQLKRDIGPLLLDVREPEEWNIVHIEGAVLAPLSILAEKGVPALPQALTPDTETVVYCHHGIRSAQVTEWLLRNGYKSVRNLRGGIDAWALQIDPALPRYG
jgi:rhodanese-related sulfurtransferase